MLIRESINVDDSGESLQKKDNKVEILEINNRKKIIFALSKSINEIKFFNLILRIENSFFLFQILEIKSESVPTLSLFIPIPNSESEFRVLRTAQV